MATKPDIWKVSDQKFQGFTNQVTGEKINPSELAQSNIFLTKDSSGNVIERFFPKESITLVPQPKGRFLQYVNPKTGAVIAYQELKLSQRIGPDYFISGPYSSAIKRDTPVTINFFDPQLSEKELSVLENRDNIKKELSTQYNQVNQASGYSYQVPSSLDKIFSTQASKLSRGGVESIYDLEKRVVGNQAFLFNKKTNKPVTDFPAFSPNENTVDWGFMGEGTKGDARFLLTFSANGLPVFVPAYEKESNITRQALAVIAALAMPSPATIGQAIGLSGTAAAVAGGAIIGATTAAIAGADPVKGAALGTLNAFTTANYAAEVGKTLGVTNETVARTVGNAVLSSGLSGIQAAVTGQDIGKSMLAGAGAGAITANAEDIANAVVGGQQNLQTLISNTNISLRQAQAIISNTIADALVTEIRGGDFITAVQNGLIAGGLSTSLANEVASNINQNVAPASRTLVFTATKGVADTAVRAGLNNQDIGDALAQQLPGIIVSSRIAFEKELEAKKPVETAKTDEQVAEEDILNLVQSQLPGMEEVAPTEVAQIQPVEPPSQDVGVEVAGPVSPDILARLESMPLFGETVVSEQFIDNPDPEIGGRLIRTIQGFRNDGTPYSYDIATFEDGTVVYSTVIDGEVQILDARPDLKNSAPGVGDVQEGAAGGVGTGTAGAPAVDLGTQAPEQVVDPAYTVGFDLRDYGPGSPTSPNLAVFEIGGGRGVPGGSSTETTFNLISRDTITGEETYDVGGRQYSLIVLPDKQVLLPKEPSEVVVYLERDPVTNLPKMKEVPTTKVPPNDAKQIADKEVEKQVVKEATQETQAPGGATEGTEGARGDEGAVGGLTGETASPPPQPVQTTKTEEQKVAEQILSMAVRRTPVDMRYDLNKDGKVTSADAAAYLRGERPILEADITLGQFRPDTVEDVGGQVGVGTEGDTTRQPPIDELGDVTDLTGGGGGGGPGGPGGGVGDEITDEEIIGLIRDQVGDLAGGEGEGLPRGEGEGTGTGDEGEGLGGDEGKGLGTGDEGVGPGAGDEGEGPGRGGEGEGTGEGEGEGGGEGVPPVPPPPLPPPVITTVARQQPLIRPPEGAPYRVTGQDESGILGRKQPLFGGDEDLQRAEWNRRSLRLRRLLGL